MSLGDLMLQGYPSGVYQPGPPSSYPSICIIRTSLDISYSSFVSSELLALELLLPPNGTPMNIIILDDNIYCIPYISQVPSTSPIADQFPMEA